MKGTDLCGWFRAAVLGALLAAGLPLQAPAQTGNPASAASGWKPEAAFCELEPIDFSFQNEGPTLSYTSSRARIFATFHPADKGPSKKPLFVFFNGGPGCATCDMLFSLNTAPHTLDLHRTQGRPIRKNRSSWTKIGNLLHVDAPETGFSYNLMEGPEDPARRAREFGAQNFNTFLDAAQMVRVILRFLVAHPSLQGNPVVLVGESYAGTRATIMLHLLLYYAQYAEGSAVYRDPGLVEEVQRHLDAVFPDLAGCVHPPEEISRQFGRQILIEPLVTGEAQIGITGSLYEQEGSVIYRIAAETGTVYEPCQPGDPECDPWDNALEFVLTEAHRDMYKYDEASTWTQDLEDFAMDGLSHVRTLSKALGEKAAAIEGLPAGERAGAYRYKGDGPPDLAEILRSPAFPRMPPFQRVLLRRMAGAGLGDASAARATKKKTLEQAFGSPKPWDDYLVDCNPDVTDAFYVNGATEAGYDIGPMSERFGALFLEVLPVVETLITDASLDLVICPAAVAPSFRQYTEIVEEVWVQKPCLACDGFIHIQYRPFSLPHIQTPQSRAIFFPHYAEAGHPVSASMPEKFLEDVTEWVSWERTEAVPERPR